jgi:hypothetical protein
MENFSDKIDETYRQEIDVVIKRMKACPKEFECVTTKFEKFCKAKDINRGTSIRCAESWSDCKFRDTDTENQSVCRCPLRCYLFHKFGD